MSAASQADSLDGAGPPPASSTAASADPTARESDWKFTQWFRKMQNDNQREEGEDSDYLSAVEFDDTGKYLATGDRSGHIVILENDTSKAREQPPNRSDVHYAFYAEFTSHNPDFDFVRSLNIEEKINQIKWGPRTNDSLYMLTTNDKVIKLWKITEKEMYKYVNWNIDLPNVPSPLVASSASGGDYNPLNMERAEVRNLRVPKIIKGEMARLPALKKNFASDVHQFNITSLSVSADKECFISGDNLRINLWNMAIANQSYNVLDIKPEDMQELNEIISSIDYHPAASNLFLYSSSLGNIRLCDLRQRALVDEPSKLFSQKKKETFETTEGRNAVGDAQEQDHKQFFDEMTQNVTAARFSKGGRFIISRDYMSVKIWDVNMEKKPVETIYVHEYLRERMWDLYSSDLLWDGFGLGISARGDVVTGSYSNHFHLFNLGEKTDTFIQASKPPQIVTALSRSNTPRNAVYKMPPNQDGAGGPGMKQKKKTNFAFTSLFTGKKKKGGEKGGKDPNAPTDDYPYNIEFNQIEFNKKILHCAWHPETNAVAIAGQNNLYIYAQ